MIFKTFVATAFIAAATSCASYAATISLNDGAFNSMASTILPGGTVTYGFQATEDVTLTVSYAVTGTIEDLNNVSFGQYEHENFFSEYTGLGSVFAGFATKSYTLSAGDTLTLGFYDGITKPVGTAFTYVAEAIPAVPVPAAGFLLVGGIAALGALKRRRQN